MSKITNDRLNPVWHRMLYSCTHMVAVGVKGFLNGCIRNKYNLPKDPRIKDNEPKTEMVCGRPSVTTIHQDWDYICPLKTCLGVQPVARFADSFLQYRFL